MGQGTRNCDKNEYECLFKKWHPDNNKPSINCLFCKRNELAIEKKLDYSEEFRKHGY